MTHLIVGLGNPGPQYQNTRHNIGFEVIEALADSIKISFRYDSKLLCELAQYKTKEQNFFLIKPQTFMNLSGQSVKKVQDYYKIENLLVIHDELDIPVGAVRFKSGGGNGGHNGLKSIDQNCGNTYQRMRCGIGRSALIPVVDYVLGKFEEKEKKQMITHCVRALLEFLQNPDFVRMQNLFTIKG
ncbi:aminoacyl-tRNA hydrolase [Helicobacter mustelae]|uniref:Peptidyl-tRNA hydrolase n=1 Tax=Helicobacter mustelae (strain ATCC 43772 / CCUG 25715 / CIP 103759 / LMG 18044 / NCTC 12198 / R85-136P) TaxID=679897 RepID=D3UHU1_HELM1|nr:aminoacyl-tRNA hydrolase [Helicobacter mustelae]CBG40064.1 peptidyl-tRNA hydrolase [Helicobacter mustelae 12198]SQH71578.1 peptidyl-tRNA hydrolase [Helicobacter mustelae]STP12703.1 peptidyl-tRNA hydrolase [Helicobacter mustelae]